MHLFSKLSQSIDRINLPNTALLFLVLVSLTACGARVTVTETIRSEPPGAQIFGGPSADQLKSTGWVTPHGRTSAGNYWPKWTYQVRKEGYHPSPITSESRAYGDRVLNFVLKPIAGHPLHRPRFGYLRLTSNAPIRVTINDVTPKQSGAKTFVAKLRTGAQNIVVSSPGYLPQTFKVELAENQVVAQHLQLLPDLKPTMPAKGGGKGNLSILTSRSGVLVDVGGTSLATPVTLRDLDAGTYEIRVGGKAVVRTVQAGKTAVLDIDSSKQGTGPSR